jgi:dihydrofolate reductase
MVHSLSIIVACAENRVIGREGRLPWRIPEDWKFFREQTAGASVILGRTSYQSWKSIFEDERHVFVISRDRTLARDRVQVVDSLDTAIQRASERPNPIYICGGQRIFEEAILRQDVERLYLTLVHADLEGDRTFPDWKTAFPHVIRQREGADENYRYTFYELGRSS